MTIDEKRAEWIKVALKDSHRDEQEYHDEQIVGLHAQYAKLQTKMDRAYDDKLEGKISEDYWQRKAAEWREAQMQVRTAIERHENANRLYFEEGCRILNMATRAYALWPQQAPADRRKLLNMILSNCTFDGTNLTATYAKPFCWLAEGSGCSNWLPDGDECENFLEIILFSLPSPLIAPQRAMPSKPTSSIQTVLGLAFEFQRLLDERLVNSQAEIAELYGISRARVTQVMNLLRLSQAAIRLLNEVVADPRFTYTERRLRPILQLPTEAAQLVAIERMRDGAMSSPERL